MKIFEIAQSKKYLNTAKKSKDFQRAVNTVEKLHKDFNRKK